MQCIHDDISNGGSTISIGNVGIFVIDVEQVHQIAAESNNFCMKGRLQNEKEKRGFLNNYLVLLERKPDNLEDLHDI